MPDTPPAEAAIKHAFLAFLAARPDAMDRSCVPGHLTSSTMVVDPQRRRAAVDAASAGRSVAAGRRSLRARRRHRARHRSARGPRRKRPDRPAVRSCADLPGCASDHLLARSCRPGTSTSDSWPWPIRRRRSCKATSRSTWPGSIGTHYPIGWLPMSPGRWRTSATVSGCDVSGFDAALAQIADWPVRRAGAAVVGPSGVVARFGDTGGAFDLASVTKPLTALAVLVAVEEGALELSDPADEQLLPGATIEHLLAHASGLAPAGRLRSFAPGVRRVYSNTGFDLLGDLVAAATTMPFSAYFAESVVAPLQLESTTPGRDRRPARPARASMIWRSWWANCWRRRRLLAASTVADASRVHFPGLARGAARLRAAGPQRLGARVRDPGRKTTTLDGRVEFARPRSGTSARAARCSGSIRQRRSA